MDNGQGYPLRQRKDGHWVQLPPTHCPNGHPLKYPNVIFAHWPKPDGGKLVRAWHCLVCETTIYDE
jgi:hypothetical protein